ncbi:carboxypeptidase-like regulatory domain-containing protein [Natrinema thermotolerans]|uniref:Carboxypeptidase-like regulatory domain-containing protein n=1 Tax=Natrinema thermotolerans TaxID=121872 RepID=A0AAF0SZK7_9EURY|nr:carboxypeptidase-like regulatory domain-containing protein [Natrinema thermotolerans]WPH65864.1 carboxypeptidase regulatory-like domain-containing protein [Haloarchaeal virus HJTV-4]QCC60769.1 carboxypeptidase regulatory-like domain-containing protein [Natrinema thermotolerans]QCC61648.1 carboxypeptidase regulatory-like domain-containing protein [Natrinema thermotolerans]WMT07814.1 carboxypeptidase-like regulatory domain-containing protein [Natrinema thermotolerans]WMT08446.1 carboxypeptida
MVQTISGTVTQDGSAAEHAVVAIYDLTDGTIAGTARTDSSGNYSIDVSPDSHNYAPFAWLYEPGTGRWYVEALVANVTDAAANPYGMIDNFERGNLNPYSGSPGSWQLVSGSDAITGNYSLYGTDGDGQIFSYPGDGLGFYPSKGDVFSLIGEITGNLFILYNVEDSDNCYFARPSPYQDDLILGYYSGGNYNTYKTKDVTLSDLATLEYEVEWHDGNGSQSDDTTVLNIYSLDSNLERNGQVTSITGTSSVFIGGDGVGLDIGGYQKDGTIDTFRKLGTVEELGR